MEPQAPFSHSPLSELSMLLQAMLIRELMCLRKELNRDEDSELKELIVKNHSAVMANIDSEAKELRGIIKEIAAEPDQTQLVAKLKAFAAKLNAMTSNPPTP